MPTIKRKRRESRSNGLTDQQLEVLVYGFSFDGSGFSSQQSMCSAWRTHRRELLTWSEPGRRPAAYYECELGLGTVVRWFDQIHELMNRGLIDAAEAIAIERDYHELSVDANDSPHFFAEDREGIERVLGKRRDALRDYIREFDLCAAWHAWRDRTKLAEIYRRRANNVREALDAA